MYTLCLQTRKNYWYKTVSFNRAGDKIKRSFSCITLILTLTVGQEIKKNIIKEVQMIFFAIIYMCFFLIIFIILVMDLILIAACMMTAKWWVALLKHCTAVYNTLHTLQSKLPGMCTYSSGQRSTLQGDVMFRFARFNLLLWPLFKSIRKLIMRGTLVWTQPENVTFFSCRNFFFFLILNLYWSIWFSTCSIQSISYVATAVFVLF